MPEEDGKKDKGGPESEIVATEHPRMIGGDMRVDEVDKGRESQDEYQE